MIEIISDLWINFVLVLLALIMNSGMDSLRHSFSTSFARNWVEQFWNPALSWKNKYENYELYGTKRRKKWHSIVIPAPFTDGWHLLKMFMLGFIMSAMSLNVTGNLLTDFYLFCMYAGEWNLVFNPVYYKLRKW